MLEQHTCLDAAHAIHIDLYILEMDKYFSNEMSKLYGISEYLPNNLF